MPIRQGSYGYKRGPGMLSHANALKFGDVFKAPPVLPASVDLTKWIVDPYDQGQLGSCVLNAWAALVQYGQFRSGGPNWTPSRLFAYWNARAFEGTITQDAGSYVHDAFHQGRFIGIIPETEYPYDVSVFANQPPATAFTDALKDQMHFYANLDNSNVIELKTCLAHGYPFELGFQVPTIFEDPTFAANPILDSSTLNNGFVGGHGVAYFGYDDAFQTNDGPGAFLVRNSWGTDWGVPSKYNTGGYFHMSYKLASNLDICSDAWMVRFLNQQTSLA